MSWDKTRSVDRINAHLNNMDEIEIKKLAREADLSKLLTETCCRKIYGAHVYVLVSNFSGLASGAVEDEDYRQLIQAVHIYQREVSHIVEHGDIFDGLRVHFQGPKLHALFYRPIDQPEELAKKAFLLQLVLKDFVSSVFNPAFPKFPDFEVAGGADMGDAIGTRNGTRGDRELLFLGASANHAAKIVSDDWRLRITESVYDALPEDLQDLCDPVKGQKGIYQIQYVTSAELDDLLEKYGIGWKRDKSAERVEADKEQFPLRRIAYESANALIVIDDLSVHNNKRVHASSLFADVSGFTKYIDDAETEEEQRSRLRVFHVIRKEMAAVIRSDFNGIRVQYQGDRAQGLYHLPKDDPQAIAEEAVLAAVGLQSSMEQSIKECLPEAGELTLAIGVDIGTTLVSKLGTRAHRDRICLGMPVERAAQHEERCQGTEIGIGTEVYTALPEYLKKPFKWRSSAQCYVASGLTQDKVERLKRAQEVYEQPGRSAFVETGAGGTLVRTEQTPNSRPNTPARPYGP